MRITVGGQWGLMVLQFVSASIDYPRGCTRPLERRASLEPGFRSLTMNSNLFSLTHPFFHMDMLKCIIFLP